MRSKTSPKRKELRKDYFRAASLLKKVPNYSRLTKEEAIALFVAFFGHKDPEFNRTRFREIALREPPEGERPETYWERLSVNPL